MNNMGETPISLNDFPIRFLAPLSMLVAQIQADEDKHSAKEEVDGDGL